MSTKDAVAELHYIKDLELYKSEKPFQSFINIPEDSPEQRVTNLEWEAQEELIRDIRRTKESFTLDENGFTIVQQLQKHPPTLFEQQRDVESVYLPELEAVLRQLIGGFNEATFFDWRLRSPDVPEDDRLVNLYDPTAWLRPACRVHVDQSPAGVLHRVELQSADRLEEVLQGRVRIFNFWRPISYSVEDYPLAVCDGSSVRDEDFIDCDHIRKAYKGSTMFAKYRPGYRWHYLSEHSPDELLIMKMFDSDADTRARCCPHTSFLHPKCPKQARPRKSIEVRCLVYG